MNDGVLIALSICAGVFSMILEENGVEFHDSIMLTLIIFGAIGFGIGAIYGF